MSIAIDENTTAASISTIIEAGPIGISFSKVTAYCRNYVRGSKSDKSISV
jgi:hypothetical protein